MKTITRQELVQLLAALRHSTFISFTALTTVKTPVGAPVIKKLSRVNVCVGHYQQAVRNRQAKGGTEPTFIAKPRKWGAYHPGSMALVEHSKDDALKHYLSAQVLKAKPPIYLVETPPLKPGKRPRLIGVEKAAIQHLLPPDRTAETAAAQGLSEGAAVIHRDYSLDSISAVSMGGKVYRIAD